MFQKFAACVGISCSAILFCASDDVYAAPGDLDPSFGTGKLGGFIKFEADDHTGSSRGVVVVTSRRGDRTLVLDDASLLSAGGMR